MIRSTERILTTHAGALPRSEDLRQGVFARAAGEPHDQAELAQKLKREVAAVVRKQADCGVDIVNDGEFGKTTFTTYVRERLSGFEVRQFKPGDPPPLFIASRELKKFPEYFTGGRGFSAFAGTGAGKPRMTCVAPLQYIGQAALKEDLANFRAALEGVSVQGAFLPANTPGTIEHWLHNAHYPGEEAFLQAISEVMRVEYQAIVEAGFTLQIDDPDLPDAWQMYPEMSLADYRRYAGLRVEALNHALQDIPREKIRLHVCWGSFRGPHQFDIPLKDIVDIVFRVRAGSYSIEASNPCHEHEWQVFETAKIPEGAVLIPGVIGHCSDFIEHPELVAQRLVRYANLVGRENVVAGTDCGLGPRVGHANIAWAKLEAMAEGARIATRQLWGGR